MKNLFLRTGANPCQPTVFLFSETQIKEEVFVEDINNVLNTGEIPNLFAHEEKAQIIEAVRPLATKEVRLPDWLFPDPISSLFFFFVKHPLLCE